MSAGLCGVAEVLEGVRSTVAGSVGSVLQGRGVLEHICLEAAAHGVMSRSGSCNRGTDHF